MRTLAIILYSLLPAISANDGVELHIPSLVRAAEVKYELPEGILAAMIKVESNGNHKALNKDDGTQTHKSRGIAVSSYGLMQIQLASAVFIQKMKASGQFISKKRKVKPADLLNPETNIEYGAYYIKWLLKSHQNNVAWALTCFNAGPNSHACKHKKYYGAYVGKVLNALVQQQVSE